MNNSLRAALIALSVGVVGLLGACSGADQLTGIEGTGEQVDRGVAAGPVESFGSIYLNGVRFDTRTASILINGEPAKDDALKLGMVVQVEGTVNPETGEGIADAVHYTRALRGAITTVVEHGLQQKALTILGQTVLVDAEIPIAGTSFEALQPGMWLTASGVRGANGTLVATRLNYLPVAPSTVDVEGRIQALDAVQQRFAVEGLLVDYAEAAVIYGDEAALAEGQVVAVSGKNYSGGVLQADAVSVRADALLAAPGSWLQVDGLIEHFASSVSFTVRGVGVDASDAEFLRGNARQLEAGTRVVAEGRVDADGRLKANQVTVKLPSQGHLWGVVEDINAAAGTFTVLGTRFAVDRATGYEDRSSAANRFFRLSNLAVGDTVEVFTRQVAGQHIANRVRRVAPEGVAELSGSVTDISGTAFTIMNVRIDASAAEGVEALAGLHPGDQVRVQGTYTGAATVMATRVLRVHPACEAASTRSLPAVCAAAE